MSPADGRPRGGGRGARSGQPARPPSGSRGSFRGTSRGSAGRRTSSSSGASSSAGRRKSSADGDRGGTRSASTRSPTANRQRTGAAGLGGDQVEGRQAVRELLAANLRPVRSVLMAEGMDTSPILDEIEKLAAARRVRVERVSKRRIDMQARTEGAQGVVALARPVEAVSLEALCAPNRRGKVPFLLVVDGITDPHNLGAVLRSAECAGVTGVVLPSHRSVLLSPTVTKVAAGAIEFLPMTLVPGVPAALQRLSTMGVWTVGLVGESHHSIYDLAVGDEPVALVIGSEGNGLGALTRKRCDALASIPQHGSIGSLNVATAGAIACFEVARRRSAGGTPAGRNPG